MPDDALVSPSQLRRVKVLDCTLRDGGFYNRWDFDEDVVRLYLRAVAKCGLDVVELGYRSVRGDQFFGRLKYTADDDFQFLREYPGVAFALMIDAKEFVRSGACNADALRATFRPAEESPFGWIRVAMTAGLADASGGIVRVLKDLGYRVTVNVMQVSQLQTGEMETLARTLRDCGPDVLYFADSFGSMYPEDVARCVDALRRGFDGEIGAHTHDNLTLAFANARAAVAAGACYVDATIRGMGRGAGNLKTENFLMYLRSVSGNERYRPEALFELVDGPFAQLQGRFGWGPSATYTLSALQNIHPTYCQTLAELGRYTSDMTIRILGAIEPSARQRFSDEALEAALVRAHEARAEPAGSEFPALVEYTRACGWNTDRREVLVVGAGPSVKRHQDAIQRYIDLARPLVVECNLSGQFDYAAGFATLLHERHLADGGAEHRRPAVVYGNYDAMVSHDGAALKFFVPYHIAPTGGSDPDALILPAEVVGMYALGLGLRLAPRRLVLVGFDGYADAGQLAASYVMHQEMQGFLKAFSQEATRLGVVLVSATPTLYDIRATSIYWMLAQAAGLTAMKAAGAATANE